MNKLKSIYRILFPKKVQRKSKLELAFTFPNGRTLWTYGENDFLNISSRYYSAIQTEIKHLEILHQTKAQWQKAIEFANKTCVDILENDNRRDTIEKVTQIKELFSSFDQAIKGINSSTQTIVEMMFCMFYLLDDEHEYGYNEAKNAEKLALINSEPAAKELFFCK